MEKWSMKWQSFLLIIDWESDTENGFESPKCHRFWSIVEIV